MEIAGQMGNNSFLMKTAAENNVKEFYIDDHLVMTVLGKGYLQKHCCFNHFHYGKLSY